MAGIRKVTSKIVLEYMERFPKTPNLTLARKIYAENKDSFTSVDSIRFIIRMYKGQSGNALRDRVKDKRFFAEAGVKNPFAFIPEEFNENPEVWRLPKNFKKVLVISDFHIPYHDTKSIKACFEYAKKEKVDCVYINGDLVDFFQLSFHEKDRRKRPSLADELEMTRTFLKGMKEYFNCPIYYKPANHEHRLERFLVVKAPELLDCPDWRLDVLIRLGELKIEYINRRAKCYFGKLLVEHGDRMKGTGGVSPARTLYLKYKRHAMCGHFHKKTEHSAKVYDGNCILTFSIGSLCCLEPEYFEVNEHTNGFAIVDMDGEDFRVRNYTIEKGKVY